MHDERARLHHGPTPDQRPDGFGLIRLTLQAHDPEGVLERVRDVLDSVITLDRATFDEDAPGSVPHWFVEACTPEPTPEEQQAWLAWWRTLDHPAKAAAERERGWTLQNWLSWMEPGERTWWWWDGHVTGPSTAAVSVVVEGWPTALGALHWLLTASGAREITEEDSPPVRF